MFAQCGRHVVDFGGGGACSVVLCVSITMTYYSFPGLSAVFSPLFILKYFFLYFL